MPQREILSVVVPDTAVLQKFLSKIDETSTHSLANLSEIHTFLMKFGRTRVIIGPSKAKNHEESAGDVHFGVAAQKPRKNAQKRAKIFKRKFFRRQKIKCWESSETRFPKVSRRSERSSRGKRSFKVSKKCPNPRTIF